MQSVKTNHFNSMKRDLLPFLVQLGVSCHRA